MLCREGKISLICFFITIILSSLPIILLRLDVDLYSINVKNISILSILHIPNILLIFLALDGFTRQIAVRATFLGYVFATGVIVYELSPPSYQMFGIYTMIMASFHYSEFLAIAWTNPKTVTVDSFILNHSPAYKIAAASSWLEYFVERYYFPEMKEPSSFSYFGLIICISGEIMRKLAIFTAKHNFNHQVQSVKQKDHELVTHGVFKICRHPSYVGWFYWSIGSQLVLQNPFCAIAYTVASWRFFYERIYIEEITLLSFFGEEYMKYQKEVGTGLPFISGYKIDL